MEQTTRRDTQLLCARTKIHELKSADKTKRTMRKKTTRMKQNENTMEMFILYLV